jgi:hypothetical protein
MIYLIVSKIYLRVSLRESDIDHYIVRKLLGQHTCMVGTNITILEISLKTQNFSFISLPAQEILTDMFYTQFNV